MIFKGNPSFHSTDSKLHTCCGSCFPLFVHAGDYDLANKQARTMLRRSTQSLSGCLVT